MNDLETAGAQLRGEAPEPTSPALLIARARRRLVRRRVGRVGLAVLTAAAVAVAVAVAVAASDRPGTVDRVIVEPPAQTAGNPPVFVVVQGNATYPPPTAPLSGSTTGPAPVMQVRSSATGKLYRTLGADAGSVSLNGDGSTVYFESTAGHGDPTPIERISTGGGRPVQVASGEDPAVSPDGADLAYAVGGDTLTVDDLRHHSSRRFDLQALIGPDASFYNTPGIVTWLSDTELMAIPPQDATTSSSLATSRPAREPHTCSGGGQCAIFIQLGVAHPVRLANLPLPSRFLITAAGPGPTAGTVLVGSSGTVVRLTVKGMRTFRQATLAVPGHGLVAGFSPDGRHVLYLRNDRPVQLWSAEVTGTRIAATSELIADAALGSLSW